MNTIKIFVVQVVIVNNGTAALITQDGTQMTSLLATMSQKRPLDSFP